MGKQLLKTKKARDLNPSLLVNDIFNEAQYSPLNFDLETVC